MTRQTKQGRVESRVAVQGSEAREAVDSKRILPAAAIRAAGILSRLGLAGLIALIAMPSVPEPKGLSLDASWDWGLNMAHAAKLAFGRDLNFTYGPLAYLALPAFPEAEPWAVFILHWGIAAITAYALWQIVRASSLATAWFYAGLFWLASVFPLGQTAFLSHLTVAIIALGLSIAIRVEAKPWIDLSLLFLLSATAALIKLSLFAAPLTMALYFAVWFAWPASSSRGQWKPAALAALVFPVAFFGLFLASNRTFEGFVSYLRSSWDIVSGYSDAMAFAGPFWVVALAAGSCFVLFVIVPLAAGAARRMALGFLPLAVFAFVVFKADMVRQDGHSVPFQFELALGALFLNAFRNTLRSRIVIAEFSILSMGMGLLVQYNVTPQLTPGEWDRAAGRTFVRDVRGFLRWPATVKNLEAVSEQALEPARLNPATGMPLLLAGKRVTALPFQIDVVRANHLQWQPMPIIQTYSAYTPLLDRMEADELSGGRAPDKVLMYWYPIDEHHLFYESPQTWRALLNHYDLQLTTRDLYLLDRRKTPRYGEPVPAGELAARWNQWIALPPFRDDEILLMQAELRENLKGALTRTLLRSPAIYVYARLRSGAVVTCRINRLDASGGVLASDWPKGLSDMVPMFLTGKAAAGNRVVSVRFTPDRPDLLNPVIAIRWLRQPIRSSPAGEASAESELKGR